VDEKTKLEEHWYTGITRYQWLVLLLASLGWVFDVFEGQIFVVIMNEAVPAVLPGGTPPSDVYYYINVILGGFLLGGALGGVLFGMLSDRVGRKRAMTYTILMYSLFTCLSAFAEAWWQLGGFRFLVALGVGGEWAVASTLVAEVFPSRARAWSQSIFHASSVLGTYLAVAAGVLLVAYPLWALPLPGTSRTWQIPGWRLGLLVGALPALLIIWIRTSLREPERWVRARADAAAGSAPRPGNIADLFAGPLLRRTLVGVGLAAVGLATFWGTHIYGKDVMLQAYKDSYLATLPAEATPEMREEVLAANAPAIKRGEMLGMFLVTTGGGLGLLSFGPISERLGRRGAFLLFVLGGLATSLILFQLLSGWLALCSFLPVFGFLTLGMHAGYAVYFPELYPTRLRGTGGGFCFNVGRLLAAPILVIKGLLQSELGLSLRDAASLLSLLFLFGSLLLLFAPETKGQDLPE
jgi:MFS family permease